MVAPNSPQPPEEVRDVEIDDAGTVDSASEVAQGPIRYENELEEGPATRPPPPAPMDSDDDMAPAGEVSAEDQGDEPDQDEGEAQKKRRTRLGKRERAEAKAANAKASAERGATPKMRASPPRSSSRASAAGTVVGATTTFGQMTGSHAWSTGCACGLEGESSLFTFMLFVGAVTFVYLLTFLIIALKKKLFDAAPEEPAVSTGNVLVRTAQVSASMPKQPKEVPLDFTDLPVHWEDQTREKTVFVLAPEIYVCKHLAAGYVYHYRRDCHTLSNAKAISTLPVCRVCRAQYQKSSTVVFPDSAGEKKAAIDKKCI